MSNWHEGPRDPNTTMKRRAPYPKPCPVHYAPMVNGVCPACERKKNA